MITLKEDTREYLLFKWKIFWFMVRVIKFYNLTYSFIYAISRVCHLKGKKAGTNRPAFIDK